MPTASRQRGFTLTETLAVLAVAGIGLSLAAPGLRSISAGNERAAAVNALVSTMHLARSEAVTRNARVAICASEDGERCGKEHWEQGWIAWLDDDADGARNAAEALIDRVPGVPGLELSSAQFERAFSYRPNGRAMGASPEESTGEFTFCEPGAATAARVVIVRATGLPALSDKSRDGEPADCRRS